jgi:membrane protease YdiL (CAAX protease family)|tara:strand:- start:3185 stop:3622 length:438 start_codon:yes stop_codon:yes gene_type:complete
MQPDSTLGYFFLFLAVVIVAPIGEEIVFRGFLQKFLENYWKDITRAVLVTSLFFAMIHFNPFWTIQIYLLGVILGFLAWKTKSVIPSIILHSVNNGTAFLLSIYDDTALHFYLWNKQVSPIFILIAIYLIYKGIEGINISEGRNA